MATGSVARFVRNDTYYKRDFPGCSRLTAVMIPNNVTTIGNRAFADCSKLASVAVQWTEPLEIPDNAFQRQPQDCPPSNVKLCVPQGTANKYASADVWKDYHIEECVLGIAETPLITSLR